MFFTEEKNIYYLLRIHPLGCSCPRITQLRGGQKNIPDVNGKQD